MLSATGQQHRVCIIPQPVTHSLVFLKMGKKNFPKHVELTGIINKPLLLHLVGCLYYLCQWCTVKQISDNEIYLLIKYIKSVLWRVAKRLSYIEDTRCRKITNPVEQNVLFWEDNISSDGQEFIPILQKPKFYYLFTTDQQSSTSGDKVIQSTLFLSISVIYNLILFPHLRLIFKGFTCLHVSHNNPSRCSILFSYNCHKSRQ